MHIFPEFQTARRPGSRIEVTMNRSLSCIATFALFLVIGCTPAQRSPDNIRQETAKATSAAARDSKAVVEGVVEGLKTKGPLNINKASSDELQTLPGINAVQARRIISARPYANSDELAKRHVIAQSEYNRIATRIVAR